MRSMTVGAANALTHPPQLAKSPKQPPPTSTTQSHSQCHTQQRPRTVIIKDVVLLISHPHASAVTVIAAIFSQPSRAAVTVIDDPSFFQNINHTLIDFEIFGDGTPILLPFKGFASITNEDEYLSQGIRFDLTRPIGWGDTATPGDGSVGSAADAFGAGEVFVGPASNDLGFRIEFTQPIFSFGMHALTTQQFSDLSIDPTILAYDADDNLLGEISLGGDLVDGAFGVLIDDGVLQEQINQFGFLGLWSDTPIARIEGDARFRHAAFDNLHFSTNPIPAPGVMGLALPVALASIRRRQR
jgi:hypothetical protein